MKIEKKSWPQYFNSILSGEKKLDLRVADFEANVGDVLVLREWDPEKKQYTGRSLEKKITYVMRTKNLNKMYKPEDVEKYGFMVMQFE